MMEPKLEVASHEARKLLLNEYHGILSTHSKDVPGYPFGSVMPYCLGEDGQPVILISRIAQHTQNIETNNRVSLIVTESDVDNVHTGGRLTWMGKVQKLELDQALEERYYSFFPSSRNYHKTHDFDFYRINLVRGRFIGGFGKAFWVDNDILKKPNPFFGKVEQGMVNHMNEDHVAAMVKYCHSAGLNLSSDVSPAMAGIDSEGMHLRVRDKVVRIPFPAAVNEPVAVRKALVDMAKVA